MLDTIHLRDPKACSAAEQRGIGLRFAAVGAKRVPLAHSAPRGSRQISAQVRLLGSLPAEINLSLFLKIASSFRPSARHTRPGGFWPGPHSPGSDIGDKVTRNFAEYLSILH